MLFNRENIRRDMTFNPDMSIHQAIMDMGYNAYQKEGDWHYQDMLDFVRLTYGEIAMLAIMVGNYNYQVENGGHMQYLDNGYASEGKDPRKDPNCGLAQQLLDSLKKTKLSTLEHGKITTEILSEFIDRTVNRDFNDRDDYEEDDYANYDDLDGRYYKINELWMKEFENYLKSWMEKNESPIS